MSYTRSNTVLMSKSSVLVFGYNNPILWPHSSDCCCAVVDLQNQRTNPSCLTSLALPHDLVPPYFQIMPSRVILGNDDTMHT